MASFVRSNVNSAETKRWAPSSSSSAYIDSGTDDSYRSEREDRTSTRTSNRSWSQETRLWLLKSRKCLLMWKRLFVIVVSLSFSTYTLMTDQVVDNKQAQLHESIKLPHSLLLTVQHTGYRQLFQELPPDALKQWPSPIRLENPVLSPKPIMLGLLWPSRHPSNGMLNDETTLPHSLSNVVVSINPQDYSILNSDAMPQDTAASLVGRRTIVPQQTTFAKPFLPSHSRQVSFDINYTSSISYTEDDEEEEDNDKHKDWPIPEGCEMQYEWQKESYPTCNNFHEQDLEQQLSATLGRSPSKRHHRRHHKHNHRRDENLQARLLAAGGYRNVWMLHNGTNLGADVHENPIALKTLLYEHEFYESYYARHNLDALVSSRLQSSPYIMNLYGYCGNSGLYEFASQGNLYDYTRQNFDSFDSKTKLKLSYNVARAISDLHNMAKEGVPVVSHTDIFPNQFVRDNPHMAFKLNDFNRGRWIHLPKEEPWLDASSQAYNETTAAAAAAAAKESCGFTFARNRGNFRSPEEYAYRLETEAIDIYSMGNVFYFLLTGEIPFGDHSRETVKKVLKEGRRQRIPKEYKTSDDPFIQSILDAISISWIHEPSQRATARQVERLLRKTMVKYNIGFKNERK